jgi:anthranilate/para-aminobenzoate synthase component I
MAPRTPAPIAGLPRFNGGVVGYFGYDLVRFMERLPTTARTDLHVPDMVLLLADNLVVFDHVRHKLIVIANMRVEADLRGGLRRRGGAHRAHHRRPAQAAHAAASAGTARGRRRGAATSPRPSTRRWCWRPRSTLRLATSSRWCSASA